MRNPFRDGVFPEVARQLSRGFGGDELAVVQAVVEEHRRRLRLQDVPGGRYDPVAPYDWDSVLADVARARGIEPLAEKMASMVERYARRGGFVSLMHPTAREALRLLRARGHDLAAVTNGLWAYQRPVLEALGLGAAFERVSAPDLTGTAKPEPRAFYVVCDGRRAPDAVHVGDDLLYDVAAARRAGLRAIWVVPPRLAREEALRRAPPWERPAMLAEMEEWRQEVQRGLERRARADGALVPYCLPDAAVLHVGEVPAVVEHWDSPAGATSPGVGEGWQVPILPLQDLGRALVDWFERSRRPLPWRRSRDPYRVLVSEFMLQQTRVGTVTDYFERFMARFPDIHSLARASEEAVLQAWQGLGYYRRARLLREAARRIVEGYGGQIPDDPAELRRLPGIGPYMAAAVASIAYGRPEPAIDANAGRVLSRLLMMWEDFRRPRVARELAAWARSAIPPGRAGDFVQGLMELGSRICRRPPRCPQCPVQSWCATWAYGLADELPPRRVRPHPREVPVAVAWVRDPHGRLLLVRRQPDGLLGGLWGPPAVEIAEGSAWEEAVREAVRTQTGVEVEVLGEVGEFRWEFSHRSWRIRVFAARPAGLWQDGQGETPGTGGSRAARPSAQGQEHAEAAEERPAYPASARWADERELATLPMPSAFRRMLQLAGTAGQGRRGVGP